MNEQLKPCPFCGGEANLSMQIEKRQETQKIGYGRIK